MCSAGPSLPPVDCQKINFKKQNLYFFLVCGNFSISSGSAWIEAGSGWAATRPSAAGMPQPSVHGSYSPRVLWRPTRFLPGLFEKLLLVMLTGSLALGYFDYKDWVTLPTMLGAISFIFSGIAFVVPVGTSLALSPFQKVAGSASSMVGGISMGMAAASTWLISVLPNRPSFDLFITFSVLSSLGSVLALLALLFAPGTVSRRCDDAD